MAGISEITADVETQKQLVDILIDNRFKNILEGGSDSDELYDRAKSFAKSETDKEIATLKAKQTDLENKVSKLEHAVTTTSKRYSGVKNYVNIEKQRADLVGTRNKKANKLARARLKIAENYLNQIIQAQLLNCLKKI